jgi:hypothetical protein
MGDPVGALAMAAGWSHSTLMTIIIKALTFKMTIVIIEAFALARFR